MSSNIQCYSVRQLSPFVGNIQIVQADYCRALSSDGYQWQIQASCETHQQVWNISADEYIPRRYVLYGSWDIDSGLSSLPLDPMLDVPSLEHIENTLLKTLQHSNKNLPFDQVDHYECWLIDQLTSLPLAMLNSVTHDFMIQHTQSKLWQAVPQQQSLCSLPDSLTEANIQDLEKSINQQADKFIWFKRLENRSGSSITGDELYLPENAFPELLINETLLSEPVRSIAKNFINWQSPRLLGLHFLSPASRSRLEQAAQHYARDTSKRLNIYPYILSDKVLNKILVEMKLRES